MSKAEIAQADRNAASALVASGAPGLGNGNKVIAAEIKGKLHDDYLVVQAFARHRIASSPAGDAALRKALRGARDALLTVGNDYPGSSCQQWCADKARETWNAINPWAHCPSTHCERAQECRSVNECSAERSALATPPSVPAQDQKGEEG